jgi:hypothetical protein
MRGGGGCCGVSANENSCAHHVTWSPNKLCRSNSIFNLWTKGSTIVILKINSKSIILFFFSVQLSEPTRYSDVFDYVVKHICSKESEDDYTIVLLVTDGGVTDFQETKEVLVRNSHMPISVVLVRLFFL